MEYNKIRKYFNITLSDEELSKILCHSSANIDKTIKITNSFYYSYGRAAINAAISFFLESAYKKYDKTDIVKQISILRRLTEEQLKFVDELVTKQIKKGQPLTHIYSEHEAELPISLRSLYNYIDNGWLHVRNIDLRRKVTSKPRKKRKKSEKAADGDQFYYRYEHTYQ